MLIFLNISSGAKDSIATLSNGVGAKVVEMHKKMSGRCTDGWVGRIGADSFGQSLL